MNDPVSIAELNNDKACQKATDKFEAFKHTEEYKNRVQLKFEALLADSDRLSEAVGYDGIQYPDSLPTTGLWEIDRKAQLRFEECIYYPALGEAVMRGNTKYIGELFLAQIKDYLMKEANEWVEEHA